MQITRSSLACKATNDWSARRVKAFARPGDRNRYGRDRPIDVLHIDLAVTPDLRRRTLDGRCALTVTGRNRSIDSVELDAVELDIHEVADALGSLTFAHHDGTLRIELRETLAQGAQLVIVVHYQIRGARRGIYFTSRVPGSPVADECWTHGHDTDARAWFPCVDEPSQRQKLSIAIVVDSDLFALGNGELTELEQTAQTSTYRYALDRPIPSYLVTMVVGRFVALNHAGAAVPVRSYVPPGRELEGLRAFENIARMIGVFEAFTGSAYPYSRYSQIAVAEFPFVGMENATAATLTRDVLQDDGVQLTAHEGLIAHELAHQWFGVSIIARDWSEVWLNESFATYLEAVWIEHERGWDEYLYAIHRQFTEYLEEATTRYIRPVVCSVYRDPLELFDKHAYQKGSVVLHALRGTLGEERFRAMIARYVRDHADQSVETIDLARAAEQETGRNIREFLDQWVNRAGHPEISVSARYEPAQERMRVRVEQRQRIDVSHPAYRFSLEIVFATDLPALPLPEHDQPRNAVKPHVQTVRFDVDEPISVAYFPMSTRPALVRIDPNGWLPAAVSDDLDIDHTCAALRCDPSPLIRIRAARNLVRDASHQARMQLEDSLANDPFWGVRAELATALGAARVDWAGDMLGRAIGDPNPHVRRAIFKALGEAGFRASTAAILAQLEIEPATQVAGEALRTLGKMRAPQAYDILMARLEGSSTSDAIVAGALLGLGELGDERAIAQLREYGGRNHSSLVRRSAVSALAAAALRLSQRSICQNIIAMLTDSDMRVRQAAIDGLERLGGHHAIDALLQVSQTETDPRLRRYAERSAQRAKEQR